MTDQLPAPHDLSDWWPEIAARDLAAFRPKLEQYGSHDLLVVGTGLNPDQEPAEAMEAGCAFYALGKVARVVEAVRTGRDPGDDSWHDLTVYSMMARRIRATGGLS
jgi:hypothetical protein